MKLSLFTTVIIWLAMVMSGMAQSGQPRESAPARDDGRQIGEAAPLIFWNREITVFRAYYEQISPAQRATNAAARIAALPEVATEWTVEANEAVRGKYTGAIITANGEFMFGLMPEDLDPESSETLKIATDRAVSQLRAALESRTRQRSWPLLLKSIAISLAATLIGLLGITLAIRAGRKSLSRLERTVEESAHRLTFAGINFRPLAMTLQRGAIKLTTWAACLTLAYLWLAFVLMRFPYSQPWGEQLGTFLTNLFKKLGAGVLESIPGVFAVLVIFLLTRIVVRLITGFFREVEDRALPISWLHPDTARATRRLIVVLIWIFALIVSYPYIPGSDTNAFKGVSVFVGLMVSLGSAGLINQIMSGLVVIYSRALKIGEFVRVGDDEGLVSEVGMLSTKIVTRKREEITIPNAVLVGTRTVNYSRLAGNEGAVFSTSVTIGYDAPWRQVHAMLLLAAERTAGVRKNPRPHVVQQALADFYVEYQLLVNLDRPEDRVPVLSELHAQIQDAFNEFGVQIMSPHFERQPSGRVFVPKSQWFTEPAEGAANSVQRKTAS
ncbi:MAG: mechanosensitive ion channel family protein [Acidobacteria bacterium]|nr:mechanosensitive ion channel family protein [Acidobacteriota bacterium]